MLVHSAQRLLILLILVLRPATTTDTHGGEAAVPLYASTQPPRRATRRWAVKLATDTLEHATVVAERDGFINRGRIGALDGYFLFEAVEDVPQLSFNGKTGENSSSINEDSNNAGSSNTRNGQTNRQRYYRRHIAPRSTQEVNHMLARNTHNTYQWFEFQERRERVRRRISPRAPFRRKSVASLRAAINTTNPLARPDFVVNESFNVESNVNDPLWHAQWNLHRSKGNNMNVIPVWKNGYTGAGVQIAIVDDGMESTHADLIESFVPDLSYDYIDSSTDVSPRSLLDNHGTRCAGQIVAKPNNSICNVGIAYDAKVSAIKLIGDLAPSDADEASAFNHLLNRHDIYSSSWGPKDDGASVEGPGMLASAALQKGVETGRRGFGAIYVFASGNGGRGDNCNYDGYANSIYTVSIGSVQAEERLPQYGELCAAHLVVSYGGEDDHSVATTDINHSCCERHTGTSAAAPFASGMIALALQARPDLSWRDVQHLLVRSTVISDTPGPDYDWITNNAGLRISHRFGFGVLDADKLVRLATTFVSVPYAALRYTSDVFKAHAAIPLSHTPLTSTIEVSKQKVGMLQRIEHVQIRLSIRHHHRGMLTIKLLGPVSADNGIARTESVLATERKADQSSAGLQDWTFMTVRHWDENPIGNWTLIIMDGREDASKPINSNQTSGSGTVTTRGLLENWQLIIHGSCDTTHIVTLDSGRRVCIADSKSLHRIADIQWGRVMGGLLGVCVLLAGIVAFDRWWYAHGMHKPLVAATRMRVTSLWRKRGKPIHSMPRSLSLQLMSAVEEGSSPLSSPQKTNGLYTNLPMLSRSLITVRVDPLEMNTAGWLKEKTDAMFADVDSTQSVPTSPTHSACDLAPLANYENHLTKNNNNINNHHNNRLSVRISNSNRASNNDPSATPFSLAPPVSVLDDSWQAENSGGRAKSMTLSTTTASPSRVSRERGRSRDMRSSDLASLASIDLPFKRAKSSDTLNSHSQSTLPEPSRSTRTRPQSVSPPTVHNTRNTMRTSPSFGIIRLSGLAGESKDQKSLRANSKRD